MAKVYLNGTWKDCVPRVLKDGTDTFATLPAKIYTNDLSLGVVALDINGNAVQNGTPTPDTPVLVEGCGTLDNGRYKIPVTLGSQTQNISLDTTTTTRRIKKLVLDGSENWKQSGSSNYTFYVTVPGYLREPGVNITMCSHYGSQNNITGAASMRNGNISFYANVVQLDELIYVKDSNHTTPADFKSYLQQQYAAGTPVTVWYVLATEESATVNEPLMKIGNYADTVSLDFDNVLSGEKEISVDTSVQPSSVVATHHGWHKQQELIRSNGEWTTPNVQLSALQSPLSFAPIEENENTEETEEGGDEYEFER